MGTLTTLARPLVLAAALVASACTAGDDPAPGTAIESWAVEQLGMDRAEARCTADRVAAAGIDHAGREALVRDGLAAVAPEHRQAVADAIVTCTSATDEEIDG